MTYISLVGTQIMAVLNPLLALIDDGRKPETVVLLATPRSLPLAETIQGFLTQNGYAADHIRIEAISDTLEKDDPARPPAHLPVSDLAARRTPVAFNLAGGMNFQVAACVAEMTLEHFTLLYPESEGIQEFHIQNNAIEPKRRLPLPRPLDVLTLQRIPFEKVHTRFNPFLGFALKTCALQPPADARKHIRIGEVTFDFIWNQGNTLKFLKVIHGRADSGASTDHYLREARKVMNMATGREAFTELYHRDIAVVTNIDDTAERLNREGGGKIDVIHFDQRTENTAPLCAGLRRLFSPEPVAPLTPPPRPVVIDTGAAAKSNGSFLLTAIGPNIMPTLIALWSHVSETACLLYTPGSPIVEQYKDALIAEAKSLPVKTIIFRPVGIVGAKILDIPAPAECRPMVNITPGTKGHAAFLAVWARTHGGEIYTIDTGEGCLKKLPHGKGRNLNAPSPTLYLKLTGAHVLDYGESKGGFLQHRTELAAVRDFIRRMTAESRPVSDFPSKAIELNTARFDPGPGGRGRIRFGDDPAPVDCRFDSGNEWFERLVGFVMAECGARDVQIRFRSRWSPEAEKRLKKRFGQVHLSDVDVIARFGPNYYVISCKATKAKQIEATASEAVSFASLFGRFAVPLVCFLAYDGPPYAGPHGVTVFGHRTLTDTEAAKEMLKLALDERRTTRGKA